MRTFINNVVSLVIEGALLDGLSLMFSSNRVQEMRFNKETDLFEALANEPEAIQIQREKAKQEDEDLEKAIDSCKEKLGHFWVRTMKASSMSTRKRINALHNHRPEGLKQNEIPFIQGEYQGSAYSTPVKNHQWAFSPSSSAMSGGTSLTIPSRGPSPSERNGRTKGRSHSAHAIPTPINLVQTSLSDTEL
jgi:hypothetical protein